MLWKAAVAGSAALLSVAITIAADVPTAVIAVAQNAVVDGAEAMLGANVYAGDALDTREGGTLRLRVGAGQLFLLAQSNANLTQDHAIIDMLMKRGTAGFSATNDDPLEIDTPVGTLRPANDKRAFGQVTITGENKVLITSYEGDLALTRNGEERTIESGRSYSVTLAAASAAAGGGSPNRQAGKGAGVGRSSQWIFDAAVAGGSAVVGYFIWRWLCESPDSPQH
jgi:hypothetical protein